MLCFQNPDKKDKNPHIFMFCTILFAFFSLFTGFQTSFETFLTPLPSYFTIIHKILETNSSFYVKQCTTEKVQSLFQFSQEFFTSIDKIFILGGRLNTRI